MVDIELLQFLHLFLLLSAVTLLLIMLYSMANYQIKFDSNNSSFLCSLIDYRELPHIFPPAIKSHTILFEKGNSGDYAVPCMGYVTNSGLAGQGEKPGGERWARSKWG